MATVSLITIVLVLFTTEIYGHGMLMDPIQRSSRWRIHPDAPKNYEDNELFCGGFTTQNIINGGKCGLCGDDYRRPRPRPNELGGTFGQGTIVKQYSPAESVTVVALVTANHKGHFYFDICNFDELRRRGRTSEEESCFKRVILPGGNLIYNLPSYKSGEFPVTFRLPSDLKCEHCVLRWTYVTGNNWGNCGNGTSNNGCGPQETFRTCSDISIMPVARYDGVDIIDWIDLKLLRSIFKDSPSYQW